MFYDVNGNSWDSAEEALDEFLDELPHLSDEESESVFQFTDRSKSAEFNLQAIQSGIDYSGLGDRFAGDNYPVPKRGYTIESAITKLEELGTLPEVIRTVIDINGESMETLESILYAEHGYTDFIQLEG